MILADNGAVPVLILNEKKKMKSRVEGTMPRCLAADRYMTGHILLVFRNIPAINKWVKAKSRGIHLSGRWWFMVTPYSWKKDVLFYLLTCRRDLGGLGRSWSNITNYNIK